MDKQALLALVDEHCSKIAGNMESLLETFHSQDQAENKVLESRLSTMIHSQNIVTSVQTLQSLAADLKNRFIMGL